MWHNCYCVFLTLNFSPLTCSRSISELREKSRDHIRRRTAVVPRAQEGFPGPIYSCRGHRYGSRTYRFESLMMILIPFRYRGRKDRGAANKIAKTVVMKN